MAVLSFSRLSVADTLALSTSVVVFLYYLSSWWLVGRDPKLRAIAPRYEPPENLSPAMMRYIWKQNFDDRAFWAAVLGLVAKGAIAISRADDVVAIRAQDGVEDKQLQLAPEERRLADDLLGGKHKTVKLSMLSDTADIAVANLADSLRTQGLGRWFRENSQFALIGAGFSCIPILLAARPLSIDQWIALVIEFAVMVPAAFYGMFLALRLGDLLRVTRGNLLRLPSRTFMLLGFFISCVVAVVFGFMMLALTFDMLVCSLAIVMVALNLTFTHLLKAPTPAGTRLLEEIEGFRDFLRSVEKLPMNRDETPGHEVSRYERYLPYAVALEVEQTWADKLVALASTPHKTLSDLHATCYYLGIWRGRPLDLVVGPYPRR